MRKLIFEAALALTIGSVSSVHAANTINFDLNGAAAGGAIAVDTFDWAPDNGLGLGVFTVPFTAALNPVTGLVEAAKVFDLVAQGKLGIFIGPGGNALPLAGSEFTFQARFTETSFAVGSGNTNQTGGPQPLTSSFSIYYGTGATNNSNQILGTGYGDGTLILHGTLVSLTGTFADSTGSTGTPELLDQHNADNQNGTLTRVGNGSTTVKINVDFADPTFFLSNVTSLLIDLQDTTNNAVPFEQADPSNTVFGETPFYSVNGAGQRVNGANTLGFCAGLTGQSETGALAPRCDLHLQTDGSTSFNPTSVPEPGSLALLGAMLLGGPLGRRLARRWKAAA